MLRDSIRAQTGLSREGVMGQAMQDGVQVGEGQRTLSWIWLADSGIGDDVSNPRVQECE